MNYFYLLFSSGIDALPQTRGFQSPYLFNLKLKLRLCDLTEFICCFKYLSFMTLGCKDIGIKNQSLLQEL